MVVTKRGLPKEPHTTEGIGPYLRVIAKNTKKRILETDDNCTIMCFGATGSGKSTLGFHFGNVYNEGTGVDPELVGFDKKSWAEALDQMRKEKGVFGINDEANISARDSMSQYNKDVIDLLFSIRGKNMCLWMCNPSVQYLDKTLVDEGLINFYVFIIKKQSRYLFFTQKGIHKLLRDHKNLKFDTIKRYGKQYATYVGWFDKYEGKDWQAYLKKKDSRMDNKLDMFVKKYSLGQRYSLLKAAKVLNIAYNTAKKYAEEAKDKGLFKAGVKNPAGSWQLREEDVEVLAAYIEQRQSGEA